MTRFCCVCGHVISCVYTEVPEDFTIVPKILLDNFLLEDNSKKIDYDTYADRIYAASRKVVACPKCGRLWVSNVGRIEEVSYIREDGCLPSVRINYPFDVMMQDAKEKNMLSTLPFPRVNVSLFSCTCTHFIGPIVSPASEEFLFIPDALLWSFDAKAERKPGKEYLNESFFEKVYRTCKEIIICPKCGRIWMQKNGAEYLSYVKEYE